MSASGADFVGVIVAAGAARRFGGGLPKQFRDLGGRSVLERSVRLLADRPAVGRVVVVLAEDEVAGRHGRFARSWPGVERVVAGGATRAESVRAGLAAAGDAPFVLVHDAARPLASATLVDAVIEATRRRGAAVPLLAVPDTVKEVEGEAEGARVRRTVPRDRLRLAQTPQGARLDWLAQALERAGAEGAAVTDEAQALERDARPIEAVAGEIANRKITTGADLEELRRRLEPSVGGLRVGTGFDVHRVDAKRPLVLGGVRFEGQPGLVGHSDADVVLHAAMDAVLGAAGLGDIGRHFPPTDSRWAGADSRDLARRVAALLAKHGWRILNLDLTVLAEAPKIGPHAERMRAAIGECLGVDPTRVGIKATTLEGLGALGRAEGIGSQAVALLLAEPDGGA